MLIVGHRFITLAGVYDSKKHKTHKGRSSLRKKGNLSRKRQGLGIQYMKPNKIATGGWAGDKPEKKMESETSDPK